MIADWAVGARNRYRAATGKEALETSDYQGRKNLNEAGGDDKMPLVIVNWDEAQDFCGWAGMHLPVEAEWEYAARAGRTAARYRSLGRDRLVRNKDGKRGASANRLREAAPCEPISSKLRSHQARRNYQWKTSSTSCCMISKKDE